MEGLWLGTAVFSALNARNFTGFLKSYIWYALLILVALIGIAWVLRKSGLLTERFTVDEIQCQRGETPTDNCYGEKGCVMPSGNCYKLLSQKTGGGA